MAVRKFKPTTPGQRHKVIGTFEEITAAVPEKSLVTGKRSTGGRNNDGKMTTFNWIFGDWCKIGFAEGKIHFFDASTTQSIC